MTRPIYITLAIRLFMMLLATGLIGAKSFAQSSSNTASSSSNSSREFLMSCTYGAIAGTLVGAASLGFEKEPGDKLSRIARGTSIGLYAGILLGLYVVYVVPGQIDKAREERLKQRIGQFILAPTFNPQTAQIDGGFAGVNVHTF